jgi:hypothetical protein
MQTTIAEQALLVVNAIRDLERNENDDEHVYLHISMKNRCSELIALILNELLNSSAYKLSNSDYYIIRWNNHLYSFGFSFNNDSLYSWDEATQDYVLVRERAIGEIRKTSII